MLLKAVVVCKFSLPKINISKKVFASERKRKLIQNRILLRVLAAFPYFTSLSIMEWKNWHSHTIRSKYLFIRVSLYMNAHYPKYQFQSRNLNPKQLLYEWRSGKISKNPFPVKLQWQKMQIRHPFSYRTVFLYSNFVLRDTFLAVKWFPMTSIKLHSTRQWNHYKIHFSVQVIPSNSSQRVHFILLQFQTGYKTPI